MILREGAALESISCKICQSSASAFDVVDFSKNCAENQGVFLPLSGFPVYYYRCPNCGFVFAPLFDQWSEDDFRKHIYNADYVTVDPDFAGSRAANFAGLIVRLFGAYRPEISLVDYGGGAGQLARILADADWAAVSYDPFVDEFPLSSLEKSANLVTAFEVFEHVQDLDGLLDKLDLLLEEDGLILFSTLLSDGLIQTGERLGWWYAAPRNGHISLFSRNSLIRLLAKKNWQLASFTSDLHVAFRNPPSWSQHIFPPQ